MFIYFWERETEWKLGRGRERGRRRIGSRLQALSCHHRARHGAWTLKLRNHDLSRSRPLNWLSHTGAPVKLPLKMFKIVFKCLFSQSMEDYLQDYLENKKEGRLGGSGHDLAVREFEPRIGLCDDSSEPGACFRFCVSLSLTLPCSCSLSVSR